MTLEEKCIDAIRCLAIDAVQKANSGHPGTPMALAPAAFALWMNILHYNPRNPSWFNRDRFVLSNGHASMLQYAVLHLTGYDISIDDLKQFRQLDSITAGHPEHGLTPGIETTTGPLGQGIMNSVGMAIAEAHMANIFNTDAHKVSDHFTYAFCSDGDFMEGASHEAASVAGHLRLGKLIWLYDDNHITIEGNTDLTFSDDVQKRFEAYNWHVQKLEDSANDIVAITDAFQQAKNVTDKPSLIILRTHIGYGSPHKQDTSVAHGSPLGVEEVSLTKAFYGWPDVPFYVPDDVMEFMSQAVARGKEQEEAWNQCVSSYKNEHPELASQLEQYLRQELPKDWDKNLPAYKAADGDVATRTVTSDFLKAVATTLPWLIGGSADLGESTQSLISSSGYFEPGNYKLRNIDWGIREHLMCAASSGMMLHGGLRPFASTYFVFTDYAKPAIRLASIMKLPVIYIMTHDSIGLGEDGTTHQPIEQLVTFRAMPGIVVIRPADANEAAAAWKFAIERNEGPTMLVLTRQKVPVLDRENLAAAEELVNGAYILSKEKGNQPDVLLIATGSEVHLILEAQKMLQEENIDARVVSMPSWELFRAQKRSYQNEVLPPAVTKRIVVEAAAPEGWHEWAGPEGVIIAMREFGASAPYKDLFKHFGFTVDAIVSAAKKMSNAK
jgi:transketolase